MADPKPAAGTVEALCVRHDAVLNELRQEGARCLYEAACARLVEARDELSEASRGLELMAAAGEDDNETATMLRDMVGVLRAEIAALQVAQRSPDDPDHGVIALVAGGTTTSRMIDAVTSGLKSALQEEEERHTAAVAELEERLARRAAANVGTAGARGDDAAAAGGAGEAKAEAEAGAGAGAGPAAEAEAEAGAGAAAGAAAAAAAGAGASSAVAGVPSGATAGSRAGGDSTGAGEGTTRANATVAAPSARQAVGPATGGAGNGVQAGADGAGGGDVATAAPILTSIDAALEEAAVIVEARLGHVREELEQARASLPCADSEEVVSSDARATMARVVASLEQEVRTLDEALCKPRASEEGVAALLRASDPLAWPELHAVMVRLQEDMEADVARSPVELPVHASGEVSVQEVPVGSE